MVKGDDYRDNPKNQRVHPQRVLDPARSDRRRRQRRSRCRSQTNDELKYLRQYPNGPVYAPVTGFYSLVYGKDGLEDAEDSVLAGTDSRLLGNRITEHPHRP